jgi:hypothetical protein
METRFGWTARKYRVVDKKCHKRAFKFPLSEIDSQKKTLSSSLAVHPIKPDEEKERSGTEGYLQYASGRSIILGNVSRIG